MKMIARLTLVSILAAWFAPSASAQGTAFTYQGRLNSGTNSASGLYDLKFTIYDATIGGSQQGVALTNAAVAVSNGFFTVSLDFGAGIFTGPARWMEIGVRTNGFSPFGILTPRQALTPSPYALYAPNAGTAALATNVPAGTITATMIADGAVTTGKIAPAAVKSANIDDGGSATYERLTRSARSFLTSEALPFEALLPAITNGGAPSLTFALDGSPFGTAMGFVGDEALSAPYSFVAQVIAPSAILDANAQLGRQGLVSFSRGGRTTKFAGIVTGCSVSAYDGTSVLYTFQIGSYLNTMALNRGYRIYQNLTVPDLVTSHYLETTGVPLTTMLSGFYAQREFVMQYAERNLDFFSRLLEDEGIFYFFNQASSPPVLTLGDGVSSLLAAPYEGLRYYGNLATNIPSGADFVRSFQKAKHQFTKRSTLESYDFKKPKASLYSSMSQTTNGVGENYRFDTTIADIGTLDDKVRLRVERQIVEHGTCVADGNAADLRPGYTFVLADETSAGVGGTYLVTAARHAAFRRITNGVVSFYYGNQCEVIPSTSPYRPAVQTPKPSAHSCTATVVGTAGQEIYVDKYGRVKVQFRWDRYGTFDQNSSCWIRVASLLAGKQWGAIFLPRIGQEVIVDFLEGDPDQPVIVGSLYNADQMPPYDLPTNQTVSGIKTRSSKLGGTDNYNEIRFEDKKGSESLDIHGEKNLNLSAEYDASITVGNDATFAASKDALFSAGANLTISAPNVQFAYGIGIGTANDPAYALNTAGAVAAASFQGDGSALGNLSAAAITSGTVNDARLSSNVALRGGGNTFTGAQIISSGSLRLSDQPLYLRSGSDTFHGLGWYYAGTFAGVNPDGPVLFGCGGGALGTTCSTSRLALTWNNLGNVVLDPGSLNAGTLTPGLVFGSSTGEGIASKRTAGGNQFGLDFYTLGSNRLSIASGGNVGIGTNAPVRRLQVVDADGVGGSIQVGSQMAGSTPKLINFGDSDFVHIGETGADDRMELKASTFYFTPGSVGIGTNSPQQKLHVNGSILAAGNLMVGAYPGHVLIGGADENYSVVKAEPGLLTLNKGAWAKVVIPSGLVGIGKTNPATALDVNGTVTATAFNPPSDRNLKENLAPVSPAEVLAKVSALPITRWNFKGDESTPHVGPMAQDFHAAFGLGTDDKHIATVDADGIALAAIQGLNQEIGTLRVENAQLKQSLEELRKAVAILSESAKGR